MKYRKHVIVSLHTHNDRDCAVAAAEMGLLAGADRVEGTLFGNGERTGNADLIALALNMYSQGIDPELNFSNVSRITEAYERLTGMSVHQRHPYCGELVFAAFSGSHQDAIAKGMGFREEKLRSGKSDFVWNVPYLPIDPMDLGRVYESDVIRINSQSGKGGIGYILERLGVNLPLKMRESVGYAVKSISDRSDKELTPEEVYDAFAEEFVNIETRLEAVKSTYNKESGKTVVAIRHNKSTREIVGHGNGQLAALSDALQKDFAVKFDISDFAQHSIDVGEDVGAKAKAMSYVQITDSDGKCHWGAGLHTDIGKSARAALISAINRSGIL